MSYAGQLLHALRTGYNAFAKALPRRKPSKGEARFASSMLGPGIHPYPLGTQSTTYEQVNKYKLWAYVAIRAIAEEWARTQPQVGFRRKPEAKKTKRFLPRHRFLKSNASLQQHEEIELADSDHDLCELLRNPNGPDTSYTFMYRHALFLELTGRAYWWKVRGSLGGPPVELWHLFPQWVTPVPGSRRLIDHYEIRPQGYGYVNQMFTIDADDVVQFLYPSPLSMINGHSPTQACAEWNDVGTAIDASRWFMFENGTRPDLIINTDKDVHSEPFTRSQLSAFYAQWDERLRGVDKHGKPVVLNPGMEAVPWTKTPKEMDMLESADQNRIWQMAVYRVSSTIAGISEDENYASSVTHVANFLQRTMGPKFAMTGQAATEQLGREFAEDCLIFWPENPPTDPEQLNKDIETDAKYGAITPNEIRQLRGREPYEHGGDDPVLSTTTAPMPWATGDMDQIRDWTAREETIEPEAKDKPAGKMFDRLNGVGNLNGHAH